MENGLFSSGDEAIILNSLKQKKEKIIADLFKVNLAIAAYEEESLNLFRESPAVPATYHCYLTYNSKILYVLNKNGPLFIHEIVTKLLELEPSFDPVKLTKRVTNMTSMLFLAKKIRAEKVGRKSRYSLG